MCAIILGVAPLKQIPEKQQKKNHWRGVIKSNCLDAWCCMLIGFIVATPTKRLSSGVISCAAYTQKYLYIILCPHAYVHIHIFKRYI